MGAKEVFYLGNKQFDRRSAVGVQNYLTIRYLKTLDELKKLKSQYRLVGIENNIPNVKSIYSYTPYTKSLFIFGEEGCGIDKEILDMCDDKVYVPQTGTVRSLNVSSCAAIVMADYVQKRKTFKFKMINWWREK
jgi:tRNA G18 (ribose-2'-O)-methylase SpoU